MLEECGSGQRSPPLGLLPFLKVLNITKLDGIMNIIDADFHGNNSSLFMANVPVLSTFRGRKHKKKQFSDLKMNLLAIDVVAFDEEQKHLTDPRVRDWLLKAKDVVFDAEHLLEEIDYEAKWS